MTKFNFLRFLFFLVILVIPNYILAKQQNLDKQESTGLKQQHVSDFDGDGKTDFAVIRGNGSGSGVQLRWFINLSSTGENLALDWGLSGDVPVNADFDGDNKTDIAVWRAISIGQPSGNAFFFILESSNNTVRIIDFGQQLDTPIIVGDYDGDNKDDVAVYRSGAQSLWFIRGSLDNPNNDTTVVPWGIISDAPAPGDYDGDGKNDFVITRRNEVTSDYWLNKTSEGIEVRQFGLRNDFTIPGDFDGDGKTDLSRVRKIGLQLHWWHQNSSDGQVFQTIFGNGETDFIAVGDYDGDGKSDQASYRIITDSGINEFWVNGSSDGVSVFPYGVSGDQVISSF